MMKRKVLIVFMVITALLLCMGYAIAQTDPIVCSMELDPSKLAGPGKVKVTITISNSGDTDLKDPVVLYDPSIKIVSDFGTNGAALLKAGESKTWTGEYAVDQLTLDNGFVAYFVKYKLYKESGEAVATSQPIRGKISVQTAEAAIDVKRTISPTVAREGQSVVVKYDITNTGTVDLLNVTIKENGDIHKEKQTIEKLAPGQTAEVKYPVKMGKKNLTSGATLTYKSESNKKAKSYVVEDQTIAFGESALVAKLTASAKGVAIDGKVTLTLNLKNTGSVDYSDLRVTDASLGDVFVNQQLAAGKSLKLDKEITLTKTTDYQFNVTAIDSTGTQTVVASELVNIVAVDPKDVLSLQIVATPDRTEVYEQPGMVRFSIAVTNDSSVEAKNVTVSHGATEIYTFTSIPAGETRKLTRDAALSMAGKFRFTVSAQDPLENKLTFESNEVQIAFSVPTPAPATPTPPPVPTAEPTFHAVTVPPITNAAVGALPKTIQMVLLPLLIVAGLLLLASGVLLIMAAKRRADQRKASEAAVDHLERAKRRDYVTPAEEDEKSQETPEGDAGDALGLRNDRMDTLDEEDFELPHMKYARNASESVLHSDDDYSEIGKGLYDAEMVSDLSAYHVQSEEDVLYEQPTITDEATYAKPGAQGEEPDGYTDDFSYVQDHTAQVDEGVVGYDPAYDSLYSEYDDLPEEIDGHVPDDRQEQILWEEAPQEPNQPTAAPLRDDNAPRTTGRRSRKNGGGDVGV
ncbi:MAG: hypothetical protein RSA55_01960 [Clostridia bacterium]